jgi:hypothetical protein
MGKEKLNVGEYHRAVELSTMRQWMNYTDERFVEDWNVCLAISVLMASDGRKEHLDGLLDHHWKRVQGWIMNNPESIDMLCMGHDLFGREK